MSIRRDRNWSPGRLPNISPRCWGWSRLFHRAASCIQRATRRKKENNGTTDVGREVQLYRNRKDLTSKKADLST